jgi:lipoyl(octanoyl) transferase
MSSPAPRLLVVRLGTMRYADALALQRAAARARIAGALDEDVLLLVEHPPVVTLGRSTKATSLPLTPDAIRARGVEVHEVERGGDVTFHGPGQLVGYPIVDLKRHRKDLHWHLRQVEQGLIDALGAVGLPAGRRAPHTGVWVGEARKIASIGVHARDWVTWHGFALNVSTALSFFDLIVPCGIHGVDMTSVARELGREVSMDEMECAAADGIAAAFSLAPVAVAPDDLVTQLDEPSLALR